MAHKFLRDDGWFQFPTPADVGISTSTTTGILTFVTNSTTANISISNSSYTTGPVVTQGSGGIWYASGTICIADGTAASQIYAILTDGSTSAGSIWASATQYIPTVSNTVSMSLSAVVTNPTSNIKIQAINATGNHGTLIFNLTGKSMDCTLTAVRIG